MRKLLVILAVGVCGFTASCADFGGTVQAPQTFNEKMVVAIASVTEVRNSATTLLKAGKISSQDGQNVLDQTNNARLAIDLAFKMHSTSPTMAEDKLATARTVLIALQVYLNSRKGGS